MSPSASRMGSGIVFLGGGNSAGIDVEDGLRRCRSTTGGTP